MKFSPTITGAIITVLILTSMKFIKEKDKKEQRKTIVIASTMALTVFLTIQAVI